MRVAFDDLAFGTQRERYWLEEVAVVTPSGGRPLFSWGLGPIGA